MQSMMLTGIREMEMKEVPVPELKNDTDVLVRLKVVGVCGSDIHYYVLGKIGSQVVQYPYPVGHECAGEIVEVAKDVKGFKVGDRVYGFNDTGLGSYAEYLVIKESGEVSVIPKGIKPEDAAGCILARPESTETFPQC